LGVKKITKWVKKISRRGQEDNGEKKGEFWGMI
jgi:hypothetical protein